MKQVIGFLLLLTMASAAEAAKPKRNCASNLVNASFEHKILEQILSSSDDKNVFITAPALHSALSMLTQGASDSAKAELLQAMGYKASELKALNDSAAKLMKAMNRQAKGLTISSGSAFWSDDSLPVKPDFTAAIKKVFNAPAGNLPFAKDPAKAAKDINSWASQMTNNMIPSIITDDTAGGLAALLASAVYMKGDWLYQFDKDNTRPDMFRTEDGQMVQAEFMEQVIPEIEYFYAESKPYIIVRLPYASKDASMYIVFPKWDWGTNKGETTAKQALLSAIADRDLEKFKSGDGIMKMEKETLIMPKFTLKYSNDQLKDVLQAMGVNDIFTGGNLLGISPDPRLYVAYVRMDTALEVNEEGSQAAGVASAGMALESIKMNMFEFNRPFGLIIRDDRNMVNLFSGVIQNPTLK